MSQMLLLVILGGRRAALPALTVNAVIELGSVTPVPRAAAHIVGLAALRSRPLTVIDGCAALGLGPAGDWRNRRAVVFEHDGHLYGLLVESADDIVAAQGDLHAASADLGPGWSRGAQGWVETEAGALPLLDLAVLVAGPEASGEPLAA